MVTVLIRCTEFCMNKMIELYIHDFNVVFVIRICILNSIEEDNVKKGAMMEQHWVENVQIKASKITLYYSYWTQQNF